MSHTGDSSAAPLREVPRVQTIRGCDPITPLAGRPDFIRGVIDVRGVIVPIVDVRLKFAPSGAHHDDSAVVFIFNLYEHVIGIVVDAVFDVLTFAADRVRREPEFGAPEVQLIDTVVPPRATAHS